MKLGGIPLGLLAAASLAACTISSDMLEGKKVDYKSAGQLPTLEIPPDLTTPARDNRYVVPDTGRSSATLSGYEAGRAQQVRTGTVQAGVLPTMEKIRIERAGSQRWLVISESPEKLWPLVRDFWQENGFLIAISMPEAGVMETDWAENRAKLPQDMLRGFLGKILDTIYSTAERDKFRTRLERGSTGTTEIYVSHRGMEEVYTSANKDQTKWQPRKPDPDLEAEMLRRLMTRFGVQEVRAKQQLAAAEAPRASLARQSGGGKLMLNEQFDRAWRRVGLALDRVGFTVEDRDRSKGLYFVRYIDPETDVKTTDDKPGFIGKMVGSLKFWGNSPVKKNEQYQIVVKDIDAGAEINVLTKEGRQEQSATGNRILTLLYDQLK